MTSRLCQRWTRFLFVLGLTVLCAGQAAAQALTSEERMRKDITFLASDECEGRGPGTKGIDKAAAYIAKSFADCGLKPGGKEGYFQPFTIPGPGVLDGTPVLKLEGPDKQTMELKLGKDFQVMGYSGSGKVSAPLVFAGHGITAKEINFDDYKDLDVAGKVVVLIRRTPRWNDKAKPFDGNRRDQHAGLEKKQGLAELKKAAAVILINDLTEAKDALIPMAYASGGSQASIPSLHVKRDQLDPIFKSALGKSILEIENETDKDLKPSSAPLKGWKATIECGVKRAGTPVKNVIGVLAGSGPLADETVVVGAHYDHLGYGGAGSRKPSSQAIHHGADDNASGSTSVMELARRFAAMPKREGRRIVFITFSGEERGLLGSRFYCREPMFPLDKTVAMVNLDMVGRLKEDDPNKKGKLIVEGLGTGKGFEKMIDGFNAGFGFQLTKKQGGTGPSDHDSFYRKDIPVLFFWNGTHKEYHTPEDTSDLINVPGMKRIADLAEKAILQLASEPKRPEFVKVAGSPSPIGKTKGPRLGIVPEYDDSKPGLLVSDVVAGGAAEKAGIKAGDLIVGIAGQNITNVNTYMAAMATHKAGEVIPIDVMRGGKKLTLKATPQ